MREKDEMKDLVGLEVKKIFVEKDEESLIFLTDKRILKYTVDGDCCSESWFSDIIGVPALLGSVVTKTEEIEMPDYNVNDGRCRQEEDCVYGYKITTEKGNATIIFRNSSNGYYGGSMNCGVVITEFDARDYKEIKDDWSA